MAKIPKRIVNSYNAYLKYRDEWRRKGYGLDRELTLKEYKDVHQAFSQDGEKHIARRAAADERTLTRSEAAAIIRRLKSADKYQDVDIFELHILRLKYKKTKDLYSLQLTPDQEQFIEQSRRERLLERGKEPQYTIQSNYRAILFNQLLDAGLSYKEADEVLYG